MSGGSGREALTCLPSAVRAAPGRRPWPLGEVSAAAHIAGEETASQWVGGCSGRGPVSGGAVMWPGHRAPGCFPTWTLAKCRPDPCPLALPGVCSGAR